MQLQTLTQKIPVKLQKSLITLANNLCLKTYNISTFYKTFFYSIDLI